MQQGARYQAVYEILSEVYKDQRPADRILNEYVRARQYIGSKDRRFISETVWNLIRTRRHLEYDTGSKDPRAHLLYVLKDQDWDLLSTAGTYGLKAPTKAEREWLENLSKSDYPPDVEAECPLWLYHKIASKTLINALKQTATADLRVNMADLEVVRRRLQGEGIFMTPTPYSPYGLRSEERVNLAQSATYREGLVEVQDESCQLGAMLCNVSPDEKVIDYCAGAGGKSLAIAAINHNDGYIEAFDYNRNRMDAIKDRATRLGIHIIRLVQNVTDTDYDCFILDAPCSGSGTWRRSPDAKFRLTPEKLSELSHIQRTLLETALKHTKAGGRIVYMTCSVLPDENENIVEDFVRAHTNVCFADHQKLWQSKTDKPYIFETTKYLHFAPHTTNTDGFFFCTLCKTA